ncbi:MAG: hypothetical protein ACJAS2_000264 [Pseudohongiellaceae bacterium]|jgi:transposase
MAHALRKFFEPHETNKCTLAAMALKQIGRLDEVGHQAKSLDSQQRHILRQRKGKPLADNLHT